MRKPPFSKAVRNFCSCYVRNQDMHNIQNRNFLEFPFSALVIRTFFSRLLSYTALYLLLLYQGWNLLVQFTGKNITNVFVSKGRCEGWAGHLSINKGTFLSVFDIFISNSIKMSKKMFNVIQDLVLFSSDHGNFFTFLRHCGSLDLPIIIAVTFPIYPHVNIKSRQSLFFLCVCLNDMLLL